MIEELVEKERECSGLTIVSSKQKSPKPVEDQGFWTVVPVTGLEPVRHRWRRILSPLRLPFHHTGALPIYYNTKPRKKQGESFPPCRRRDFFLHFTLA